MTKKKIKNIMMTMTTITIVKRAVATMMMNRATIGTRRKRHALDSTTAKHRLAPGKIRTRDDGKKVLARPKKPSDRLHWRFHDRSQEVCYRAANMIASWVNLFFCTFLSISFVFVFSFSITCVSIFVKYLLVSLLNVIKSPRK